MSPGLVLDTKDCTETPDPVIQKQYRSIVAKVQFAVHRIQFDILYAAAQLARFCASAGPSHWATLTLLVGGLDGYSQSDWGNSLSRQSTTGLIAQYNGGPVL